MIELTPLLMTFFIAYFGVSTLGFGLYLIISKVRGTSPWDEVEVRENKSYQIANKWLPLINLAVWTLAAWFYFGRVDAAFDNALPLGVVWLVVAALADYIGFVLIKHPLSADHRGFYIGQAPYIYMMYTAVFAAPFLYVWIWG